MKFSYKAKTKEGKTQKGTIEASSRKKALNILEKYDLLVISLDEKKGLGLLGKNISIGKEVDLEELSIFTRQISVMLNSGISPVEALRAQISQTGNSSFRDKLLEISESVESGHPLSKSMEKYPDIFSSFYTNIIRSGEKTGKLAESMDYLAGYLRRKHELREEIKGAMIYPAFVVLVSVGAFFLVSFLIIPKIGNILKGFEKELPLTTKIMMSMADFVRNGGWILVLVLLGALFLSPKIAQKMKKKRGLYDKVVLKLPVIGEYTKKLYLTRFAENLAVLIRSGLPITEALEVTASIIQNSVYKKIIREAKDGVKRGKKISSVLSKYPKRIPPFVSQMVATGEKAGKVSETLDNVVDFYRRQVERTTKNLTSILEPILIAILGIGIGILAVSLFIPLFQVGMGSI